MSISAARPLDEQAQGGFWTTLRTRQLEHYPDAAARYGYLLLTVVVTVALYYELYVGSSVATQQIADLHVSFGFYVRLLAFGNLIGAFGSLFAGITDRLGRCNIVVAGLALTGVMVAFVIPATTSGWAFGVATWVVGLVEGICLVATPALIRDFSPQVGRAAAMGFWTMGPVLGSLVVSVVATASITGNLPAADWGREYLYSGVAGLVVFAAAFLFLRELSPGIRDQLMVTSRDRALVEARAKGLDIEASLKNPFGQLLKAEVVVSAIGVSVLLLVYYTAVGFATVFYETVFHFSAHQANNIGDWNWGINALALVVVGALSDLFRVRKPFMVIGGVFAAVMLAIYAQLATQSPTYGHVVLIVSLLSLGLGLAYTPWMASFTETVEARNPALTATGLAIWGWILRVVVFLSFILLPVVIASVTPLVNYGAKVQTYATKYAPQLTFVQKHPKLVAFAQANGTALHFAATHPKLVAEATTYGSELKQLATLQATHASALKAVEANAGKLATLQKFAPEVAVIEHHQALFLKLQANPTSPTLQAQAVAAAGGGATGLKILGTIVANRSTLGPALSWAATHPGVVAFAESHAALLGFAATHASFVAQATRYASQLTALATLSATHPAMLAATSAHASQLAALAAVPPTAFSYLKAHGAAVASAAKDSPGQWRTWYWICFGGIVVFLLAIPLLKGRWSPAKAKADERAHEAMVEEELAKLKG